MSEAVDRSCAIVPIVALLGLSCLSCGGDADRAGVETPAAPVVPAVRLSGESTFASDCSANQIGTLYRNAEVEPYFAVNPTSPANVVAMWQQDRWSNGAAQGLVAAASFDGGRSWSSASLPFSVCAGGSAVNGGNFARASDPWLSFSPDGVLYALGLVLDRGVSTADAKSGMLVARSFDGGLTWTDPAAVIAEPGPATNDKGSITADPHDPRFAYVVWDRLSGDDRGPAWFARTTDGGATWEPPRSVHDPGIGSQTIGNVIVVLPGTGLVNLFTQIDASSGGRLRATLRSMRSEDRGASWSEPRTIADLLAVGAVDPDTGQPIRDGSILGSFAVGTAGDLHAVWQDARFSNGARDGIIYVRSDDGGLTWSEPVQLNGQPRVQAFTPTVHVRSDGVIGVMYFDLRSNTTSAASLPTEVWLAVSPDGRAWTETRVAPDFDLSIAPDAGGLFLGDYHGLASVDRDFLVLHASTAGGTSSDRTNVFFTTIGPERIGSGTIGQAERSGSALTKPELTDEWRSRIDRRLRSELEWRRRELEPQSH